MRNLFRFFLFACLLAACIQPLENGNFPATPQTASEANITGQSDSGDGGNLAVAKVLVADLAAERFSDVVAHFDVTMTEALPVEVLADHWQQVLAQAGAFVVMQETRLAEEQGYDVVYVVTEFERALMEIKVVFDDAGMIAGLFIAPAARSDVDPESVSGDPPYVDRQRFTEHEVTVGASSEWALPGTLTLPSGEGAFPVVILVHGSGPNDRNETVGPNQPFRDLAWGLAQHGIATLRYDKRTLVHRQTLAAVTEFTVQEEVIDDVMAAIDLLRQAGPAGPIDAIDKEQIYILGHSLGGMLTPRIAAQTDVVAGLIVLAGADRPLEELIIEQTTYIVGLDGDISAVEQTQLDALAEQAELIKDDALSPTVPAAQLLGAPASYWLDLRGYVPSQAAQALSQPLLILQGERDFQVTMEDFRRWQSALAGRDNVAFKSYPDLNHLFIAGQGPGTPAEYEQPGYVAEEVVVDIAGWIHERTTAIHGCSELDIVAADVQGPGAIIFRKQSRVMRAHWCLTSIRPPVGTDLTPRARSGVNGKRMRWSGLG